ncbi:MAG: aminoacyl-tRNA hydrolase [Candidatus Moraniibacteriota bacterium]
MKIIIALGNPGQQYANTRHNAGFIIADELQKSLSFSEFEKNSKFDALVCEKNSDGEKILLAKPQSFMNNSGQVVKKMLDFFKIPKENLTLLHDDLDIELGSFKISTDSSAAGHNGVQSIIDHLDSQQLKRIRIGIEGAEKKKDRIIPGEVFVLQDFSEEELEIIKKLGEKIAGDL